MRLRRSRNWVNFPIMHFVVAYGISTSEHWLALIIASVIVYYPLHQLGQAIGIHKLFAHRAFTPNRWYPYVAAVISTIAYVPDPLTAAANHRIHHHVSDTDQDPHSPKHGLWHSYYWWLVKPLPTSKRFELEKVVVDLIKIYPWMVSYRKFEIYFFYIFQVVLFLLSYEAFLVVTTAGLLSKHNALFVNAFSHVKNDAGEWAAIDRPILAQWVNPIFLHKQHHDIANKWDYSDENVTDFSAWFIRRFLAAGPDSLKEKVINRKS
jgi:fatty-acid desaturase